MGVIVASIVLVVVILIAITIFVVGISIIRKAKKNMQSSKPEGIQCSKPEGIYYNTIDETKLQRTMNKPEVTHSELNDMQFSKEVPQYMEIFKNAPGSTAVDKVNMQDNPSYSFPSDGVKLQNNPAYASNK